MVGWETALPRVRWVGNPNPDKELGVKEDFDSSYFLAHLELVLVFLDRVDMVSEYPIYFCENRIPICVL